MIVIASNYASLAEGGLSLYYGYESVDENGRWCLQVRDSRTRLVLAKTSSVDFGMTEEQQFEVVVGLLRGIAWLLEEGHLVWDGTGSTVRNP